MASKMAYDLVVIGGGSGGSACARRAAGYGKRVCLIDRPARDMSGARIGAGMGGTCVNVGCVPKKLMYVAANLRESMVGHVSIAEGYGIGVPDGAGTVDWVGLKARRDKYVAGLNKSYEGNWKRAGIDVMVGAASFVDATTVSVVPPPGGGEPYTVSGSKILVAVGGVPSLPSIPGAELAISSDGFFDLPTQPKKVAVLGAGYIAVEMAGILHGLGSETHLYFRGDTVLRHGFDPYIVDTLMAEMKAHGPAMHGLSTPKALARAADGSITLTTATAAGDVEETGFDCVLSAIGRTPSTQELNLGAAGLPTDAKGYIEVDAYENTSVPSIAALGDVTSTGYELTPVAIAAGRRLADRLFGGEPEARIAYETIATVVFSHPPIGTIGLTEGQAREQYGDGAIKTKQARFAGMTYAFNDPESKVKTAMKLVLAGAEERVVGLHCIGPQSDEMLQGFAVAVRMGATLADFEASVAIHPTISEEFVTFGGWGQKNEKPYLPPFLKPKPPSSGGLGLVGIALGFAAGLGLGIASAKARL